ncbi:hypothetical protein HPB52_012213 [Rhipicephalus sanguineus]|uniref:Uncharacterized protein n=1 Tax=Rhipicephalus sanguineus TaxID=34632 RepID=A0A9D4YPE0_RHISA|nr:hypothetical protein HPB52_012213 [Rhipicephalus sanguineus]
MGPTTRAVNPYRRRNAPCRDGQRAQRTACARVAMVGATVTISQATPVAVLNSGSWSRLAGICGALGKG